MVLNSIKHGQSRQDASHPGITVHARQRIIVDANVNHLHILCIFVKVLFNYLMLTSDV